jgi:hypothetical protein
MVGSSQAYNVFSYLVLDLGFSPVTLSVGGQLCILTWSLSCCVLL